MIDNTHKSFRSTQILLTLSYTPPTPKKIVSLLVLCVCPLDLPPPPIPPPAVLKSPTHPSKAALEGRGVISPKAGEGRDKRGGGYRPQDSSEPRTSSSERKDAQDRQKTAHGGKGNKPESSTASKARPHAGTSYSVTKCLIAIVCS